MISKKGSQLLYHIWKYDDRNEIILKKDHIELLKFTDRFIKDNENYDLIRTFKNQEFYFNKGQLLFKQRIIDNTLMKPKKKYNKCDNRFITCDIETRSINNKLTPVCISFFDGEKCKSFYLSDYSSVDNMLITAISSLLVTKYNGFNIYFHNFSLFDGIFLFKVLAEIPNSNLKPILKDGKMINLKLEWKNKNKTYYINFRDSYLILPEALRKLAFSFNVEEKGYFPFTFLNDPLISLTYEGYIPDYKYYKESNLELDDYNKMKKSYFFKKWNLKNETIKYCEQDCITLYQIISKFNLEIFKRFHINIHRYPTLPSLAFAIWRCHYLKDNKIPMIKGEMYDFIKESYTGGHTDVYKSWGINIYRYDINSLYPYVMANFPMPTDNIKFFDGDITLVDPETFGFFECEVIAPSNLNRPLLQTKVKINERILTMAPLGRWKQVIFSEEMKEYKKYG